MLEPVFEADFLPWSYGFRPGRRVHDAVAEVRHLTSHSYEWIVEGFECVLTDAKQVGHLPGGPKRDPLTRAGWRPASNAARSGPAPFRTRSSGLIRLHPLPAGPDRRAHPGEEPRGEAAGIIRGQAVVCHRRPARGDRPGRREHVGEESGHPRLRGAGHGAHEGCVQRHRGGSGRSRRVRSARS